MKKIVTNNKELKKVVDELARVAEYLWMKGWAERNAGNISVNVTEIIGSKTGDPRHFPVFSLPMSYPRLGEMCFFITGTGTRMRDLARKPFRNVVLIRINQEGDSYRIIPLKENPDRDIQPTSELSTHLGIHQMIAQRESGEKVVIHTHATELIALCHSPAFKSKDTLNRMLWGMHPETMVFIPKGIGFVPYTLPGTTDIATLTISELQQHNIVLWEKHGVFAVGRTVSDTFDLIDIACKSARIWFLCQSAGFDPEGLTGEQLHELIELVKKFNP